MSGNRWFGYDTNECCGLLLVRKWIN